MYQKPIPLSSIPYIIDLWYGRTLLVRVLPLGSEIALIKDHLFFPLPSLLFPS